MAFPSTPSSSTSKPPPGPRPPQPKHWAKQYRTEIAASCSTVVSTLGAYPPDVMKTQMQSYKFTSAVACAKHIYQIEGLKGFWRGASAPLATYTIVRTFGFSVYQSAKYSASEAIGKATGGEEPLITVNRPGSTPTLATLACFGSAGMVAGALATVIACPCELTKNFAQISLGEQPKGTWQYVAANEALRKSYQQLGAWKTAMNIVKNRGFLGLWSGFRLHLLRDTLGSGIYFMTYESCKQLLVKYQKKDSPTAPLSVTLAGGVSGLVSWALTFPIDSVKTKFQRNCLVRVKGEHVPRPKMHWFESRGYRGLGVTIFRSILNNAIFFSMFELIKKEINQLEDPRW